CAEYTGALEEVRGLAAARRAVRVLPGIGGLLELFGDRYQQLKHERSSVDFQDLELLCAELLRSDADLRHRYRQPLQRLRVDELQHTNGVQLALIEAVS